MGNDWQKFQSSSSKCVIKSVCLMIVNVYILEYNLIEVQVSWVIIVLLESMYPLQDVPWNGKAFCSFGVCSRNGLAGLNESHIVSWRFTILLSEIERQLAKAPLAAAISSYLISLTHPTHAWLLTLLTM